MLPLMVFLHSHGLPLLADTRTTGWWGAWASMVTMLPLPAMLPGLLPVQLSRSDGMR